MGLIVKKVANISHHSAHEPFPFGTFGLSQQSISTQAYGTISFDLSLKLSLNLTCPA